MTAAGNSLLQWSLQMNNIWLAFVTGLTTGGVSCLAVQGGLLTSAVTPSSAKASEGQAKFTKLSKVGSFLIAKLIAYTLLGLGLGALGSALTLTPKFLGWMQIFAGLFMLVTAARLLNIHPIFRYFQIQPPKSVFRFLRDETKSKNIFTPAILGFLTILIPCGITQAMMALAIASANPLLGAGIMFAFTLGTSPLFLAMGMAALALFKKRAFVYAASLVILILGIISINTGQVLRGSTHTLQNYWQVLNSSTSKTNGQVAGIKNGIQEVTINIADSGYTADTQILVANVPVKAKLVTNNVKGCARAFTIPAIGFSKILPQTGTEYIEFTPTKTGKLVYTCSMGMYRGEFNIINKNG